MVICRHRFEMRFCDHVGWLLLSLGVVGVDALRVIGVLESLEGCG